MKTIEFVPRIIHGNYKTPKKLQGVIAFCKRLGIREVQLCPVDVPTEPAFLPKDQIVQRRQQLRRIIRTLAQNGIEGTINVLRTFMPIRWPEEEPIGFQQPRMDMEGKIDRFTPCPLDPIYRDYIRFFYAELAKTGATKLFVDDDFRYEYLGLGPTCFCPLHLREFNRRYPYRATRKSLAEACTDAAPTSLKRDWMDFKRAGLLELAVELREAVHQVNPQVRLGLMLTSTEISLPDACNQRELVEAFAGPLQPLARPGFGWYSDADRIEFLYGLTDSVFQTSLLSEETEIQAEVDLFAHTRFNKSTATGLDYQIKALLACKIKKQSIWPFEYRHRIDADHPYCDILKSNLKAFKAIARIIPDDAVMRGVKVVYNLRTGLLRQQRARDIVMYGPKIPVLLWRLGIPYTFGESKVAILTKDSFPLSKREVEDYLANYHLLIDSEALSEICALGLGRRIGVRPKRALSSKESVIEELAAHPLNGPAAGGEGCAAWLGKAVVLQTLGRKWKTLSFLLDTKRRRTTPGMLAAERDGKRIAVLAYPMGLNVFWLDETKQAQLQSLLGWLGGGALPACVENAPDLCPVVLQPESRGTTIVSLINCSTTRAEDFTLRVGTSRPASRCAISYLDDRGRMANLSAKYFRKAGAYLTIRIPPTAGINPYQVRVFRISAKAGKR